MLGCAAMVTKSRTQLVSLTLGVALCAALAAAPAAGAKAKGFELGVAAGDVDSDSAILWAKAKKSGKAEIQITDGGGFGKCDPAHAGKLKVKAKKGNDNTVQKTVKKLDAD